MEAQEDIVPQMRPVVSGDMADALTSSCLRLAGGEGCAVTVAVVDDGGALKALRRMDGATGMSLATAPDKAVTAAVVEMSTEEFFELVHLNPALLASIPPRTGIAAFPGGMPLRVGNTICGALGVSGGSAEQDQRIAAKAVEQLEARLRVEAPKLAPERTHWTVGRPAK